ncbi:polyhydroxyalkanoate synthesis regulator DNA-binding domain-containing protein [Thermomonospora umbrina]|uniref:PHB accumulation regulatory protein n=1 Tax=Thermomonospora umbrina TaxID=111806 RepID=A0A3D9SH37_9ACTN|nr:polyhydroxyalkanoate synthesis regulator DNA-binding domain-containing protein [Thermomonospora umbrina]REE95228.1 PHB accumulation regulatory protein [Thermomonospora umbrina]
MPAGPARPRRERRRALRLRRRPDGRLYDLDERRVIGLAELGDEVRAGRTFRAHRQGTGTECTNEVLVEILLTALPGVAGAVSAHGPAWLAGLVTQAAEPAERPSGRRGGGGRP